MRRYSVNASSEDSSISLGKTAVVASILGILFGDRICDRGPVSRLSAVKHEHAENDKPAHGNPNGRVF